MTPAMKERVDAYMTEILLDRASIISQDAKASTVKYETIGYPLPSSIEVAHHVTAWLLQIVEKINGREINGREINGREINGREIMLAAPPAEGEEPTLG